MNSYSGSVKIRSRRWRLRSLWLLGLVALLLLPAVHAKARSKDPLAQKLEAIRERMEKGQALFVGGKFADAAAVFDAGYKEYPYSAFLFNAGVCYQKLGALDAALSRLREYVSVDPEAPDKEQVQARISSLEGARSVPAAPSDGGVEADGAPPSDADVQRPALPVDEKANMKSLVVIETEPEGAPLRLYARTDSNAAAFRIGGENRGWKEIAARRAPTNLTLDVGRYHIVVEKFRDFNASETDIDVAAGHVHHFKANLSQGAFMAFLRVSANVRDAHIYLDDKTKSRPEWGTTPHGELVAGGKHAILVEAPGFQPLLTEVNLRHGEQKEMEVKLERVSWGFLRIDSNAAEIKVRIDDKPAGVWRSGEPPLEVKVDSGRHRLTVVSSKRKDLDTTIDIPRGQVLPVRAQMMPTYPRGAAWTQAIIGAAFIGAAVFFGTESNRLHDDLERDRQAGVLEQDDERATRGRWFAIGANAGFAIGGVLGVLAIYNFLKDPLPDSKGRLDQPAEFDDPLKVPPTAPAGPEAGRPAARVVRPVPRRLVAAKKPRSPSGLGLLPVLDGNGGGLVIGGSF